MIGMDFHHTSNEFVPETMFTESLASHYTHLYGFLLAIYSKDMGLFKYLYEELQSQLQIDEFSVIRLLKMCI